jgi:hypothetical protein
MRMRSWRVRWRWWGPGDCELGETAVVLSGRFARLLALESRARCILPESLGRKAQTSRPRRKPQGGH